jgi:hypothetical protein
MAMWVLKFGQGSSDFSAFWYDATAAGLNHMTTDNGVVMSPRLADNHDMDHRNRYRWLAGDLPYVP